MLDADGGGAPAAAPGAAAQLDLSQCGCTAVVWTC
eukprot:COSAG02_NODE_42456_length_384_cov_1.028070_1_plen_34_part_01